MNIIQLTDYNTGDPIYINIEYIGHIYQTLGYYQNQKDHNKPRSTVGVTTHNNGGFEVSETPEIIMEKIKLKIFK